MQFSGYRLDAYRYEPVLMGGTVPKPEGDFRRLHDPARYREPGSTRHVAALVCALVTKNFTCETFADHVDHAISGVIYYYVKRLKTQGLCGGLQWCASDFDAG